MRREGESAVQLMLALAGGADFADFLRIAQAYPDVAVSSICTGPDQFERFLREAKPEVCILDGNMVDDRERPGVAERGIGFASFDRVRQASLDTVFLLVLDPDQEKLKDRFAALPAVSEVVVRPVNVQAVVQKAAAIGFDRRREIAAMSPLAAAAQAGPRTAPVAMAIPQQKLIAVASWAGGVGKTTIAITIWEIVNRMGIPCLLIGFARPDALKSYLGLREPADMLQYMRRPNLDGFLSSIQTFNDWPVMIAPRNEIEGARCLRDNPTLLRDLLYMAREKYAVVVMDLHHVKEPWILEPLQRANVILMVLQPTRVQVNLTVFGTEALLTMADGKPMVEKECMYTVINMAREGDRVGPTYIAQSFASGYAKETFGNWCPPNLGVIRYDPTLREIQDYYDGSRTVPVHIPEAETARGGVFFEGVMGVVRNIFAGVSLPALSAGRPRQRRGVFGLLDR